MIKKTGNTIELYIENKTIESSLLKRAIGYFYDFVEEVTDNIADKKNAIKWNVVVKEGSARFISNPSTDDFEYQEMIPFISKAISGGFTSLSNEAQRPPAYTDFALERLRDFINLQTYGIQYKVKVDDQVIPSESNIMVNINEILGYKDEAFGSIEGRLKTITAQRGLKVILYDDLTDKPIRCYINDDLLKGALDSFDKKVYVFGTIRYDLHGEPISIDVKQIERFKDHSAIPTFREMYGILK